MGLLVKFLDNGFKWWRYKDTEKIPVKQVQHTLQCTNEEMDGLKDSFSLKFECFFFSLSRVVCSMLSDT